MSGPFIDFDHFVLQQKSKISQTLLLSLCWLSSVYLQTLRQLPKRDTRHFQNFSKKDNKLNNLVFTAWASNAEQSMTFEALSLCA